MLSLIDLFFPKRSLTGIEGDWITDEEQRKMRCYPIRFSKELLKKRGNTSLDQLVAAGSYDSNVMLKQAIKTFKFGRRRALADQLALIMAQAVPGLLLDMDHPVLCPVPLHWSRKFLRGFNQAEELSFCLSGLLNIPQRSLLLRQKPTGFQSHRNRDQRLSALRRAFRYIGPYPAPREVILIDDLATTGTTLNACAKVLKTHGVKRVHGLVVAQG